MKSMTGHKFHTGGPNCDCGCVERYNTEKARRAIVQGLFDRLIANSSEAGDWNLTLNPVESVYLLTLLGEQLDDPAECFDLDRLRQSVEGESVAYINK